ncbi:Hypothetical predicted protein, partial [Paramuricea clavata]
SNLEDFKSLGLFGHLYRIGPNCLNGSVEIVDRLTETVTTLAALYVGYKLFKPLIETAVKTGLGGERDDQDVKDIKEGSLHVQLHCFTDERFLEVLTDYESGMMKDRLQAEFSQAGIKVEGLKVEIENMVEVNKTKTSIYRRHRFSIENIQSKFPIANIDELEKRIKEMQSDKNRFSYTAGIQTALLLAILLAIIAIIVAITQP